MTEVKIKTYSMNTNRVCVNTITDINKCLENSKA